MTCERWALHFREHMALGFERFVFFTWDRGKERTLLLLADEVRPRCA